MSAQALDAAWYVSRNGQQFGPMTGHQLIQMYAAGKIVSDDFVWSSDLEGWKRADEILGKSKAAPPPPPPVSTNAFQVAVQTSATTSVNHPTPTSINASALGKTVLWLGVGTLTIAFIWWGFFYGTVAADLGKMGGGRVTTSNFFKCLFASAGECGMITGLAQMSGYVPYNPIALYIGFALIVGGIIIKASAAGPAGTSSPAWDDTGAAIVVAGLYFRNGVYIATLENGAALIQTQTGFQSFSSTDDYRNSVGDRGVWNELTDDTQRKALLGELAKWFKRPVQVYGEGAV